MGSLGQFGVDQGDSGCELERGDGEGGPGTRCAVLCLGMGSCSVAQDGAGGFPLIWQTPHPPLEEARLLTWDLSLPSPIRAVPGPWATLGLQGLQG